MAKKMALKEVEMVVHESSAEGLIQQAISAGTPVEVIERLLAMRSQLNAERAKKEFDEAMARFQEECPTIVKTKEVKTRSGQVAYKYAPIESIVQQVKGPLARNGFSYKTQIDTLPTGVKATITARHVGGHSEDTSMEVPLGTKTEIMSLSQVTAAASTFAKRYAFCNAFGILTGDEDTDGAEFKESVVPRVYTPTRPAAEQVASAIIQLDPEPLTDTQAQRSAIFRLLEARGVDVTDGKACKVYVADETQLELAESNFSEIIRLLS
jgi:hypothetical protein